MNWENILLGKLAGFRNGINYTQENFGHGIKVISVADFQNYLKPQYGTLSEINPEGVVSDEDLLVDEDILFVRSNGNRNLIGRTLFIDNLAEDVTFSAFCIRLRFYREDVFPRFYAYVFKSDVVRKNLSAIGGGANISNLNQRLLSNLEVPFPPLLTQIRISSILSAYDDLIENNTRRIALLEESMRLLYREWFVRLRFPGYEQVKVVDGLPEGWERNRLECALVFQRGFDLPLQKRALGNVPVFASTGIVGTHNVAKVKAPGIVTGRSGTLGNVIYVDQDYWPLNTTLWVREFRKVTPVFAYFLLQNQIDLESLNSGAAVPTLNRNYVHAREVVIPTQNIIGKFDEIAQPIFRQVSLLRSYNQKLAESRDLLLPRLMSGDVEG